jgi:hypothetical protein
MRWMTAKQPQPQPNPGREDKLAKALLDNLRRRKAARAEPAPTGDDEARDNEPSQARPAGAPAFWLIRTLEARERDTGARFDVALEMTAPFMHPRGDWACGVRIDGLDRPPGGRYVRAGDVLQAIELAKGRIQAVLRRAERTHELKWNGEPYSPAVGSIWREMRRG